MSTASVSRSTATPVTLRDALARATRLGVPTVSVDRLELQALVDAAGAWQPAGPGDDNPGALQPGEGDAPQPVDVSPIYVSRIAEQVAEVHAEDWEFTRAALRRYDQAWAKMKAEQDVWRPVVEAAGRYVEAWRALDAFNGDDLQPVADAMYTARSGLVAAVDQMAPSGPSSTPMVGAVSTEDLRLLAAATSHSGAIDVSAEFDDAPSGPPSKPQGDDQGAVAGTDTVEAQEGTQGRCPSCEHSITEFHHADGCWFAVAVGTQDENLVCRCTVKRDV